MLDKIKEFIGLFPLFIDQQLFIKNIFSLLFIFFELYRVSWYLAKDKNNKAFNFSDIILEFKGAFEGSFNIGSFERGFE